MAISSDEAVAKAREFANKVGWFTRMARVKEDASLIPAVWKVRLVGEYDDITIEINADSGEVSKWHSRDPSLIAYERAKPIIDNLEAQGTPVDCKQRMEILHQEQAKVLKKQKGPRSPDVDIPRFLKEHSERLAKHFSSDRPQA
jgi:hypothetical protein